MRRTVVEHVVGHRHRSVTDLQRVKVLECVFAIVPADQHLEQRLPARHTALEPVAEETDDALRDGCQGIHALRAIDRVGIGRQVLDLGRDTG